MVSESLSSSKRRAPCEPKPNVPRPRPLRSRARHPGECAAEKALKPEELCASLVVNGLIKDALKEDVKTATEDVAMAVDDSGDEMEDDVLSLCDQSEAEEETQSVDLACRLAQRVVQEGIHLDITKAVQDASHQSVSTEFEEVSAFSEEEEEDRVLDKEAEAARLEARQMLIQAAQSGRLLTALQEATAAKEAEAARLEARQTLIQAAQSGRLLTALQEATAAKAEMDVAALRQEAKQKLLAAAQDGRLAAAFKSKAEAVEVEPQEPDVESLRREARDTLLKAARDGRLASAFSDMRKAEVEPKEPDVESLRREARDTLLKAARDGRLASAFSEMRKAEVEPKEPDVESLRREARDTLLKAARDGRLASAFSETRKEQTKQQDLEVIREKARCALLNTLESGQFQKAMEEIAESRKAAEIQADPVPSLPLSSEMPGRAKRRVIGAVVRAPSESVPVDPSPPDASPTSQLAWFMAGPPSNGLRQKDFAAFNIDNRFDATEPRGLTRKSSITSMFEALGSADLVQMNAKEKVPSRLYSFKPSTPGDLCKARGLAKPGMTSSASAMALDLGLDLASKDRIGTPSMGTRCSSVGSLRSLKANKAKQLPFLGKPQKLDERGSAIDWSVNHVQSVMKKTHSWSTISAASAF